MNADKYLSKYEYNIIKGESLKSAYFRIKDLEDSITVDPTKEHVQSSGATDRVGDIASKSADKRKEIEDRVDKCYDAVIDISDTIDEVEDIKAAEDLSLRYIKLAQPSEVERMLNISRSTEGRYHQRGLDLVQKILDKRQIDTK